ncbi:MAG: hypothetical protein ACE14L_00875 [Terriglobales bacterium]
MYKLLAALLGCTHTRYTFPLTAKSGLRPAAAVLTGMYVVCLGCGKEFPYDWEQMRVVWDPKHAAEVATRHEPRTAVTAV